MAHLAAIGTVTTRQQREAPVQDDLQLLERVRRLDQDALAEIHRLYYPPLYRYISFRVSDTMIAEDLTSDVFLRLLNALRDKHAPQNTIRGWLYGVASRVVADYYRKLGKTNEMMLDDWMAAGGALPEELVAQQLSAESLHAALPNLTEDQQSVLALRFGAGMPIKQVAELLQKSEGAIKQLQLRAVAALAQQLTAQDVNG